MVTNTNGHWPGLTVGREYVVHAVGAWKGATIYYVINDILGFALMTPARLFEIVDDSIPPFWVFGFDVVFEEDSPLLTFPEWARDRANFYEEYAEGGYEQLLIFRRYAAQLGEGATPD